MICMLLEGDSMDDIKIEMFKAKWGESFLISFNTLDGPTHFMIDMGFTDTYNTFIRKRIQEIANVGILDLLVFTHIDQDHIGGGIKFLKENNKSKIIEIGDIWYNAYRHLQVEKKVNEKLNDEEIRILKDILVSGMNLTEERLYKESSGSQGSILGALILEGKYNWNKKFSNNAVYTDSEYNQIIYKDVKITILSPNKDGLQKLASEWKKELNKIGILRETDDCIFDDAFEVLISKKFEKHFIPKSKPINYILKSLDSYLNSSDFVDQGAINGSSISLLLEFNNKRLLFLADSHCETIIKSLKNIFKPNEHEKIYFDLIKISHHGSCGNTNKDLLELIDSDKFIISTNGQRFNHPDIQTIAQIVCRPTDKERVLYFSYSNIIEKYQNKEWMDKYTYTVKSLQNDIINICL